MYDKEKNNINCRLFREKHRETYRLARRTYMREYMQIKYGKEKLFKEEIKRLSSICI